VVQADGQPLRVVVVSQEGAETSNLEPGRGAGRKGGRPRDPVTAQVYEFCYQEYRVKGRPASAVRRACNKFPARAQPKENADVIRNARRHAERHGLPW
jgi:hypothetical protein